MNKREAETESRLLAYGIGAVIGLWASIIWDLVIR